MVKGRVAPPKYFLFHDATQIDSHKDRYILIEQSEHLVLLKLAFILTPYSCTTSS